MNYYNENESTAAAWLRELIKHGHIPKGYVDERSIVEVQPQDLHGYTQHHFFAGIGGWSYALRLAGWPDDRPVATASAPCQPFSVAGKNLGVEDERHLWPEFLRLNTACGFPVCFGEQVASAAGRVWLAGIRADLEALGYAVGASDLCAAGVSAPQLRQRLYWVAHSHSGQRDGVANGKGRKSDRTQTGRLQGHGKSECDSPTDALADALCEERFAGTRLSGEIKSARCGESESAKHRSPCSVANASRGRLGIDGSTPGSAGHVDQCGSVGRLANPDNPEKARLGRDSGALVSRHQKPVGHNHAGAWSRFDQLPCADGKTRRVESGTFPLAHGVPARVGRLRGYGNSIVPQLAAEFIQAADEASLLI